MWLVQIAIDVKQIIMVLERIYLMEHVLVGSCILFLSISLSSDVSLCVILHTYRFQSSSYVMCIQLKNIKFKDQLQSSNSIHSKAKHICFAQHCYLHCELETEAFN